MFDTLPERIVFKKVKFDMQVMQIFNKRYSKQISSKSSE